jgi:hypothetical protein
MTRVAGQPRVRLGLVLALVAGAALAPLVTPPASLDARTDTPAHLVSQLSGRPPGEVLVAGARPDLAAPSDLDAGLERIATELDPQVAAADDADALVVEVVLPIDTGRRALLTALLSLVGLGVPLGSVWALDFLKARFRPAHQTVVAEIPVAVWPDGSFHRTDNDTVLLVGNDLFEGAELRRGRRLHAFGLTFAVHNPSSPLRPPIGTVSSPAGPVVASDGVLVDERKILGRVPLNLRDTWIFELDPHRTRQAAHDPAAPGFQAAYGRLVLLRASNEADPIDLFGLPRLAKQLALQARSTAGGDSATAQEMLAFVDVNVSAPRDLPRARKAAGGSRAERPAPGGAYEFTGFEGAITFDDFDDLDEGDVIHEGEPDHEDQANGEDEQIATDDPGEPDASDGGHRRD